MEALETTFTLRDVFYIIGGVVLAIAQWITSQHDKDLLMNKIAVLEKGSEDSSKQYKEDLLAHKNGKHSMKKELEAKIERIEEKHTELIKEREKILDDKIERVRDENAKSYDKLEKKINDLELKGDKNTERILIALGK